MATPSKTVNRIVNNSYVNLTVNLILLTTCTIEIWNKIEEGFSGIHLKGEHGMIVFAIVHILKTLPDIMESLGFFETAEE